MKIKMATNKYLSIITLNVNGLNALVKRQRETEWIRKHDPYICHLQKTYKAVDISNNF
jgi:exonuclease III